MKHSVIRSITLLLAIVTFSFPVLCPEVISPISNKVTRAIVKFLVAKDADYAGKRIEVTYKYADKNFKALAGQKGDVTFSVIEMYPDFKPVGNIIIPIQVYVNGEEKEKLFLRTRVSVFDKIVVAKKRMKKGDIIGTVEAVVEERDIAALNQTVIRDIGTVLGKEAKTFIPLENPIYDWMVKEKNYIKKNAKIKIILSSSDISVEVRGEALQDGMLGEKIKIKNLTSGKEIEGYVSGTDEVKVE
jgi:flagella basal body P-ring formation protein FlgA